jgi:hypothetical protein
LNTADGLRGISLNPRLVPGGFIPLSSMKMNVRCWPKADMRSRTGNVRFTSPDQRNRRYAAGTAPAHHFSSLMRVDIRSQLVDHLVGDREQSRRKPNAKRFCGSKIDDQFEFGRLNYWQVPGLLALEDTAGIDAGLVVRLGETGSVTHKTVSRDDLASFIHCWNRLTRRQRHNLIGPTVKKSIWADDERANGVLCQSANALSISCSVRAFRTRSRKPRV